MNKLNLLGSALVLSLLVTSQAWADEPLGESVKLLIQAQTLDPDAGKLPVATPNAVAAREVQKAIAMPGQGSGSAQKSSNSITMLIGTK